ncbi:hypothetical protein Pint_28808 [Pistacia integerrima]|uniref:Uncharacterized protein n=1 Tax=Pistacia integerrima TaxID=434235 RepID=A0ACC0X3Y2_9ROSI|nr:hypothetical protein Pint_28808 [Pistacia integerrima]
MIQLDSKQCEDQFVWLQVNLYSTWLGLLFPINSARNIYFTLLLGIDFWLNLLLFSYNLYRI